MTVPEAIRGSRTGEPKPPAWLPPRRWWMSGVVSPRDGREGEGPAVSPGALQQGLWVHDRQDRAAGYTLSWLSCSSKGLRVVWAAGGYWGARVNGFHGENAVGGWCGRCGRHEPAGRDGRCRGRRRMRCGAFWTDGCDAGRKPRTASMARERHIAPGGPLAPRWVQPTGGASAGEAQRQGVANSWGVYCPTYAGMI
jgi:hypothetical protein